ncbi:hypothetical protein [Streptomyces mirabilis]
MPSGKTTATYRDPHRPVDERVEDLLSRMTLEEKAGRRRRGSCSTPCSP